MIMNSNLTFDSFMKQVSHAEKYKHFLVKSAIEYEFKAYKIQKLTPTQIKSIKKKLQESIQLQKNEEKSFLKSIQNTWQMNQLKLFVWVVICYANLIQRRIQSFTQYDWNFLVAVIPTKSIENLKYESLKLFKQKPSRENWTKEQDDLLISIIKNLEMENHWNEVSKLLYFKSQKKYFKNPRKCRERWYNHLDKTIKRDEWTLEQDLVLFQQVLDIGTKWAQIAKALSKQRTEHMIKNRFKSTIRKMQKLYPFLNQDKLISKVIQNINKQINKKYRKQKAKQQKLQNQVYFTSKQQKQETQSKESTYQNQIDEEFGLSCITGIAETNIQEEGKEQMIEINQDYIKFHPIKSDFPNDLFMQLNEMNEMSAQQLICSNY